MTKSQLQSAMEHNDIIEVKTLRGMQNIIHFNQAYYIIDKVGDYVVFQGQRFDKKMFCTNQKELLDELLNPIMSNIN